MQALRRNLVPILVGITAVLVSIAAVVVIVDRIADRGDDHHHDRQAHRERLERSVASRPVPRPLLGVTVEAKDGALVVQRVVAGSPAANAGVKQGDVILKAAGTDVRDVGALRRAVAGAEPGKRYDLAVRRDGKEQTLTVDRPRLAAAQAQGFLGRLAARPRPGVPAPGLQPAVPRPGTPGVPAPQGPGAPGLRPRLGDGQSLDQLLDRLADRLAERLRERGVAPAPTPR